MKKIGIVTITSSRVNSYNYGNILQNYALTKYLESLGFYVETVYYSSTVPEFTLNKQIEKKDRNIIQFIDDVHRIVTRKIYNKKLIKKTKEREWLFNDFINNYIIYTSETFTENSDLRKLNSNYDYFVTGSDQVWNPYYEGSNEYFYLGFADKNKRITYAPSFGVGMIPNEMKEKMKVWLRQIPKISIRESEGKDILSSVFGIEAELVVDPVFLLDKNQWLKIARKSDIDRKYFVVYILGKKTIETKKYIKRLEKMYRLKAVDLYTRDDPKSMFCGPGEFINLIANAEFVVTDSFHGTAFSIIFERPMVIVDRNASNKNSTYKMGGRINNILHLAGLNGRYIDDVINEKQNLLKEYSVVGSELDFLVDNSKKYLNICLGID